MPISGGAQEVAVGNTDPLITDPGTLLWFNTTNDQLLAQVNRRWQQVIQGANEVIIGPADPSTLQPGAELWYNTASNPAVLNAKVGGQWKPVFSAPPGGSEVEVADVDPYTTDPASIAEMWYDSSTDPGILYARVGTAWEAVTPPPPPIPNKVAIGGNDPSFDNTTELWYDTTKTPAVLLARVGTTWVPVTSQSLPPGGTPNQVLGKASTADYQVSWQDIPRELPPLGTAGQVLTKTTPANPLGVAWSDTAAAGLLWKGAWDAATAYVVNDVVSYTEALYVCVRDVAAGAAPPTTNRASWVLMVSGAASGGVEVIVSPDQPTDAQTDLWYDEDAVPVVPVHGMRAFWEPLVAYQPGAQVLWPESGADIYLAGRETVGEEPGVVGINDGLDFPDRGATPTVVQGLSAPLPAAVYSAGVDIRWHGGRFAWQTNAPWMGGFLVTLTNAGNIPVFALATVLDATTPADLTLATLRLSALNMSAVHVHHNVLASEFDGIARPWIRATADAATGALHIYDGVDGVNWTERGTAPAPAGELLVAGVTNVHIGHDNDDPVHNWGGPQSEVETFNLGGALQSSWVAFTQPSNPDGPNYPDPAPDPVPTPGGGASPLTGEQYAAIGGPTGFVWLADRYPAWSNVTNIVQWTADETAIVLNPGNTALYHERSDKTNRLQVVDIAIGDARYARTIWRQQDSLAITTGSYYWLNFVLNSGGATLVRLFVTAKSGNNIQVFETISNSNINVSPDFGVTALIGTPLVAGTKLFDRVGCYMHSQGARMKIRACFTGTIDIGWQCLDPLNGGGPHGDATWDLDTVGGGEIGAVAL